jgi:hypothetical protein
MMPEPITNDGDETILQETEGAEVNDVPEMGEEDD